MFVLTGDETGLVRFISTDKGEFATYGAPQSRSRGVLSMAWLFYEKRFALLRANGEIETYEISEGEGDKEGRKLKMLGCQSSSLNSPLKITSFNEDSVLCHNAAGEVNMISTSPGRNFLDHSDILFGGENVLRSPTGPLEYDALSSRLACGGKQNDLQVWDINTKKLLWKAKNVPHDSVRLEVPVWISSIAFMQPLSPEDDSKSSWSGHLIATGTAHKHIRLYDTRAQRQPCQSWDCGDFSINSILQSQYDDMHVFMADCAGGLFLYDLRNGKRIRTLDGFNGSIRDMSLDKGNSSHLAAVSLDRYVKVYDCRSNKKKFQAYLKNRLNCTLVFGDNETQFTPGSSCSNDTSESEEEDENDMIEEYVDSSDEISSSDDADNSENNSLPPRSKATWKKSKRQRL